MEVVEVTSYEDRVNLANSLKARKTVIVSFSLVETDVARKVYEFLCGVTYGLDGTMQKVSNNVYLFTPANVDVFYSTGTTKPVEKVELKSPWK